MAYSYDQIFAADPANPANIAQNAAITIFAPGDVTMTPLTITDPDGQPLANPIPVNANGFGSAFAHATLDRVAWAGGGFTGFFTSYEGMKNEAVAARAAAEAAATNASGAVTASLSAAVSDADAAAAAADASASAAAAAAAATVTTATINGSGRLILTKADTTTMDAGPAIGPVGPQGEPGPNTVPTDDAIAAAVNNGASATKAALNATYVAPRGKTTGGPSAPLAYFNVQDYGAVSDGVTDDSAAIQAAINAAGTAGGGTVLFAAGDYLVNTSLTFPLNRIIRLQGASFSASGPVFATRLKRTGTNPIVNAAGTGMNTNVRIYPEFKDISFDGGGATSGDVVHISRASHALFDRVRVTNSRSTGLHLTELWDSHAPTLIIEACGSGTASPALLLDSVVGGGADANCATVQFGNLIMQSNYGTDIRLTGSSADGSICNDVEVANLKMEGTGAGTSGSPDTYPYIDFAYAQNCQFAVTRISVPTGRAPLTIIQQTGSPDGGPRANQFALLTLDVAGSNSPQRYIDWGAGAMMIGVLNVPSNQPTVEYFRLFGAPGRFKIGTLNHNSPAPWSGLYTDTRTINEELGKGHAALFPPRASGSATASTVGNSLAYGFATAATNDSSTQVVIPRDAHPNGQCRLRLLWTTTATTGQVHWRVTSKSYAAGQDVSATGTVYETLANAPAAANALVVTTMATGPTPAPGGLLTVFLQRMAQLGDDTAGATAYLLAAELVYDRRN